jgi:Glycosyl hydrolase family 115
MWINTIQLLKTWEQMSQAYVRQTKTIWIVNVGDLDQTAGSFVRFDPFSPIICLRHGTFVNFRYFECASLNTLREDEASKGAFILSHLLSMGSGCQGYETPVIGAHTDTNPSAAMDYMNWTDLQVATGNFVTNQELDPHSYDAGFGEFQLRDTFLYKINEGIDPAKLLLSGPAVHGLPNASKAVAAEEERSREQSIQLLLRDTTGTHAAQLQLDPPNMWEMHFEIFCSSSLHSNLKKFGRKWKRTTDSMLRE